METHLLNVERIVNCTGPSRNYAQADNPLVANLRASGSVTPDFLGLGLETDTEGRLLQPDGQPSPGLFTLGPLRVANLWESVAIPEIRVQAATLAGLLIAETERSHAPVLTHA